MGLRDVVGAGGEDDEDEPPGRHEQVVGAAQGVAALPVRSQVQVRPEGTRHERDALPDRRVAEVAEAKVEPIGDTGCGRALGADLEHRGRRVDADHGHTGSRDRAGDSAGADTQLHDGPARGDRLLDVELDVLGDAATPGVVEPRDRVVGALLAGHLAHFRDRHVTRRRVAWILGVPLGTGPGGGMAGVGNRAQGTR